MPKAQKETIENLTLRILQKGPLSAIRIIEKIWEFRPETTKQGVYRVLRKLKEEEKIVAYKKSISLNLHWIKNMNKFFSLAQFHYLPKSFAEGFLGVGEGDKIIYFFKDLNQLDAFCTHAIHIFAEISDPKEPVLVFNPHEWFAYAREEAEEGLIKTFSQKKKPIFIISTHNDPLDRELKRQFQGGIVKYHIVGKASFKSNYYFNIFGDYLIEVFLDKKAANQIDKFFRETTIFNNEAKNKLAEIISGQGKSKVIISKNRKKAEKYRKFFSKYFFLKRGIKRKTGQFCEIPLRAI